MECPYCQTFLDKKERICPSCHYPAEPERRKEDRRKRSKPPPDGIERRKGPRRSSRKDRIAWGL